MFYGEYEHSIDNKGRLIIPAKFREAIKDTYVDRFFVTRGLDSCLFIFTEDEWKKQESKFKSLSFTSAEARQFNRLYFSGASEVTCDKQGRILVPDYLKQFAHIKREVMVIGVSNRIEVWSKDQWNKFFDTTKGSFEAIAEKIFNPAAGRQES